MLTLAFNVQPAKSEWTGTVYIRADGSIDPPTAPIITYDNVTYTLTDNITSTADGIVVERDNIVIDGEGFIIQGTLAEESKGLDLTGRTYVIVKHTQIKDFTYGIYLNSSNYNSIVENNITKNWVGVELRKVSSNNNIISGNDITANEWSAIRLWYFLENNSIVGNHIANNYFGICLSHCYHNILSRNNITANKYSGIGLDLSSNNTIIGNNIANNQRGLDLFGSFYNTIYHNNLINNTEQARSPGHSNFWDDGYPSGGNYWSDYTGVDANGDGIGDTPYVIDDDNQDRYPLMHPWSPLRLQDNTRSHKRSRNHGGTYDICRSRNILRRHCC